MRVQRNATRQVLAVARRPVARQVVVAVLAAVLRQQVVLAERVVGGPRLLVQVLELEHHVAVLGRALGAAAEPAVAVVVDGDVLPAVADGENVVAQAAVRKLERLGFVHRRRGQRVVLGASVAQGTTPAVAARGADALFPVIVLGGGAAVVVRLAHEPRLPNATAGDAQGVHRGAVGPFVRVHRVVPREATVVDPRAEPVAVPVTPRPVDAAPELSTAKDLGVELVGAAGGGDAERGQVVPLAPPVATAVFLAVAHALDGRHVAILVLGALADVAVGDRAVQREGVQWELHRLVGDGAAGRVRRLGVMRVVREVGDAHGAVVRGAERLAARHLADDVGERHRDATTVVPPIEVDQRAAAEAEGDFDGVHVLVRRGGEANRVRRAFRHRRPRPRGVFDGAGRVASVGRALSGLAVAELGLVALAGGVQDAALEVDRAHGAAAHASVAGHDLAATQVSRARAVSGGFALGGRRLAGAVARRRALHNRLTSGARRQGAVVAASHAVCAARVAVVLRRGAVGGRVNGGNGVGRGHVSVAARVVLSQVGVDFLRGKVLDRVLAELLRRRRRHDGGGALGLALGNQGSAVDHRRCGAGGLGVILCPVGRNLRRDLRLDHVERHVLLRLALLLLLLRRLVATQGRGHWVRDTPLQQISRVVAPGGHVLRRVRAAVVRPRGLVGHRRRAWQRETVRQGGGVDTEEAVRAEVARAGEAGFDGDGVVLLAVEAHGGAIGHAELVLGDAEAGHGHQRGTSADGGGSVHGERQGHEGRVAIGERFELQRGWAGGLHVRDHDLRRERPDQHLLHHRHLPEAAAETEHLRRREDLQAIALRQHHPAAPLRVAAEASLRDVRVAPDVHAAPLRLNALHETRRVAARHRAARLRQAVLAGEAGRRGGALRLALAVERRRGAVWATRAAVAALQGDDLVAARREPREPVRAPAADAAGVDRAVVGRLGAARAAVTGASGNRAAAGEPPRVGEAFVGVEVVRYNDTEVLPQTRLRRRQPPVPTRMLLGLLSPRKVLEHGGAAGGGEVVWLERNRRTVPVDGLVALPRRQRVLEVLQLLGPLQIVLTE